MRRSSAATIAVSRPGSVMMRSLAERRARAARSSSPASSRAGSSRRGRGAADPIFVHGAGSPLAVQAPHSEAAADLNGDGKVDLAVASYATDSVAIFAGNGAGGFAAPISVAAGDGPLSLAVADLNRDGHADLAVANSESDNLSILLGNGSGSFQARRPAGRAVGRPVVRGRRRRQSRSQAGRRRRARRIRRRAVRRVAAGLGAAGRRSRRLHARSGLADRRGAGPVRRRDRRLQQRPNAGSRDRHAIRQVRPCAPGDGTGRFVARSWLPDPRRLRPDVARRGRLQW